MNVSIRKGKIDGFLELIPEPYQDDRGFLTRVYDKKLFESLGLPTTWTEESHHHTRKKNILRGLYVQTPPFCEGKLLYVILGEMLWVSVDVRKGSSTFGMWDSVVLSDKKKNLLCTVPGFAHGCLSLTDEVDLLIKSDNYFSTPHGVGIIWNDRDVGIDWGLANSIPFISKKDEAYPSFNDFIQRYGGI